MPITPTNQINAATMAANWGPGLRNNAQKWLQKYLAPKRLFNADPAGASAAWQTGIQDAITSGSYASGLANADPNLAAQNAQQYGVTNLTNAATNKAQKFAKVAPALAGALNTVASTVAAMPRGRGANNEARMLAQTRGMSAYKGKIK